MRWSETLQSAKSQRIQGTVLISGGTAGIGLASVMKFLDSGFNVATFSSNESKTARIKKFLGQVGDHRLVIDTIDLTDFSSLEKFVDRVEDQLGSIRTLINNAAFLGHVGQIHEASIESISKTVSVNLIGTIALTSIVAKRMNDKNIPGVIINVSSGCSVGLAGLSVYSATKAGLNIFSCAASRELSESGISVFSFIPGHVDTEMQALARNGDPIKSPVSRMLAEVYHANQLLKPAQSADHLFYLATNSDKFSSGATLKYTDILEQSSPRSSVASVAF